MISFHNYLGEDFIGKSRACMDLLGLWHQFFLVLSNSCPLHVAVATRVTATPFGPEHPLC